MLFTGYYERNLDEKKRLQVPAQFRSTLDPERDGDGFFLGPGTQDNTLALYPDKWFKARADQLQAQNVSDAERVQFMDTFFSQVVHVDLDKQGRFIIPDAQHAIIGLADELVLSGAKVWIMIRSKVSYERMVSEMGAQHRAVLHRFLREIPERPASAE